jgi:hypothetical protein
VYRVLKVVAGSKEHRDLAADGWESIPAQGRIVTLYKWCHEDYIANRAQEYMGGTEWN